MNWELINNAQRQESISQKRVTSSRIVIYDTLEKTQSPSNLGKKWYDGLQEIVNYRKVYSLLLFHKSLETIVRRRWLEISVPVVEMLWLKRLFLVWSAKLSLFYMWKMQQSVSTWMDINPCKQWRIWYVTSYLWMHCLPSWSCTHSQTKSGCPFSWLWQWQLQIAEKKKVVWINTNKY